MAPLLPSSFNFVVFVMLLTVTFCTVQARCPSNVCFCSRSSAASICNNPTFSGQCEVVPCFGERCTGTGFGCQPKISVGNNLISSSKIIDIRNKIRRNGGCQGNLCLAIDGSGSIDAAEYQDQISFVTGVFDVLSPFVTRVAGTQYSDRSYPIKPLSTDFNAFKTALTSMAQVRRSTSISSGIEFCFEQLQSTANELKKVVVLGDGFQNVDQKAIESADKIRNISVGTGFVSVVAVEPANDALLFAIAGKDPLFVFKVKTLTDRKRLADLIEDLSLALCQSG